MFVIYAKNIRFFYKEAKVKPRETLYINAKHAIVSDEGFVRLFNERGEQIFAGCLKFEIYLIGNGAFREDLSLKEAIPIALSDKLVKFTDISAEEV